MPTASGDTGKGVKESLRLLWIRSLNSFLERLSRDRHEQRNRHILFLTTSLLITLLIVPSQQFLAGTYKAGEIVTTDIRATQDYLLEDTALTDKKRVEAAAAAPVVYDFNGAAPLELTQRFEKALAALAAARGSRDPAVTERLRDEVAKALGIEVTGAEVAALQRVRSDRALLVAVGRLADRIYPAKLVADLQAFTADRSHGIEVLDSRTGQVLGGREFAAGAIDLVEARKLLHRMELASAGTPPRDLERVKGLFIRALRANLTVNRAASEERKRSAAAAVSPALFQVKRGEMIVRVGERINPDQARKLEKIFASRSGANRLVTTVGLLGLVMVLSYFPFRFARKNIRKFRLSFKDLFFLAFLTVGHFLVLKLALLVSTSLGGIFTTVDTSEYAYLFPFALGAMVVRIILNSEVALVYTAISAPLMGVMFNNSLPITVYALLGGLVGAHGVRQCADRGTIYSAGLKVSVVNFALALSFEAYNDRLFSMDALYCGIFALAGGLVTAAFVNGTIPVIETLLEYATDIKLLELSNLNSPVLRELMVRAPGTYHHSVVVGNLVEAAAEAINANPLLARVAAYYHDVGKTSKPLYFIENTGGGENRHDKLSPHMSALILIAHVKEGVELAKEHRLGQKIVDIIRQSHGTSLITFFYQKAKTQAGPDGHVDEQEFRYPGPKPQTREAGLVLLADCVEAASRTLADPTPARIQGMVQKLINNVFIDGQLDECELTLQNLHQIAKSFIQVLTGIHHHRIDYPEPAHKERSAARKQPDGNGHEPSAKVEDRQPEPGKNGGDNLRRLGIGR